MHAHTLQLTGWPRTALLAGGAAAGTLLVAGLIHLAKKGRPEKGPKGWGRTALLSIGAFAGTMGAAGLIHVVKGGQGSSYKRFVEET